MDAGTIRALWVGGLVLAAGGVAAGVVAATQKPATKAPVKSIVGHPTTIIPSTPTPTTIVVGNTVQTSTAPQQFVGRQGAGVWVSTQNPANTDNMILSVNGVAVNAPLYQIPNWQYNTLYTVVWSGPDCGPSGTCTLSFTLVPPA
jgi:hypothetical protein